jgi:hypothetical protein
MTEHPLERNLDGFYYRVERNNKFVNRCFTDLNDDEQNEMINRYEKEGLMRMIKELAVIIRDIGDQFDIFGKHE